jgi:hypothetical protein
LKPSAHGFRADPKLQLSPDALQQIMSQMLTLFTTPVTYMYLDQLRLRGREKEPVSA